jgi:REP element-mobilizing transposase RayT
MTRQHNPLTYHIFFRTKYRRPDLETKTLELLNQIGPAFATQFGATEVLAYGCHDEDHVHLLINLPGNIALDDFIRNWKSATGRMLNFQLGRQGAFWQRRYLAKTVNNSAGRKRVKEYIEERSQ